MGVRKRSVSSTQKRTIIFLFGILVFLTACSPTNALPNSQGNAVTCPECEELACPAPVRYEDQWGASPHADTEAEAFNHWNEDDPQEIPTECAKCHSRSGFMDFLGVDGSTINQVDKPVKTGTTITCYVCHNDATEDLNSVVFSSGATVRLLGPEVRCILCHQGRASTPTVDNSIAEVGLYEPDARSTELVFINSHSTSAATPFGSEVQGAYQYPGKEYKGKFSRGDDFFSCLDCHNPHSLELKFDTCGQCHTILGSEPSEIRVDTTDYDGDGNVTEGISYEISTIHEALYTTIKAYAVQISGIPIAYDIDTYPFFFIDSSNNGVVETHEGVDENKYNVWTPRLLKAAYNYNYITHDLGAYAHNSDYALQILYDSIADLGGDVSRMSRP